jgi:hypothetical protein
MKYADGFDISLGDRVQVSNGDVGSVVASVDSDEYNPEYPKENWAELKTGILVLTDRGALVHFGEEHSHLLTKGGPN